MIIVRPKPNPYQVMFMVAALLAGLALLVFRSHLGSSISQALPGYVTLVLGAGLVLGGLTTLIGMYAKILSAPWIERAGVVITALLLFVYSGFTLEYVGTRGLITVIFFLGFGVAGVWRAFQLGSETRSIEHGVADAIAEQEGER